MGVGQTQNRGTLRYYDENEKVTKIFLRVGPSRQGHFSHPSTPYYHILLFYYQKSNKPH